MFSQFSWFSRPNDTVLVKDAQIDRKCTVYGSAPGIRKNSGLFSFFPGLLYLVQGGGEVATHLVEEARPCVFSIKQGLAYFQFDCSGDFGAELNGIFAVTKFAPFPCQYEVSIQIIIILLQLNI